MRMVDYTKLSKKQLNDVRKTLEKLSKTFNEEEINNLVLMGDLHNSIEEKAKSLGIQDKKNIDTYKNDFYEILFEIGDVADNAPEIHETQEEYIPKPELVKAPLNERTVEKVEKPVEVINTAARAEYRTPPRQEQRQEPRQEQRQEHRPEPRQQGLNYITGKDADMIGNAYKNKFRG